MSGASVVQDVCIDKCCIQDVEKDSFPPLDGTVCKTVIIAPSDQLKSAQVSYA